MTGTGVSHKSGLCSCNSILSEKGGQETVYDRLSGQQEQKEENVMQLCDVCFLEETSTRTETVIQSPRVLCEK